MPVPQEHGDPVDLHILPQLPQGASDSTASAQGLTHKPATKDSSSKSPVKLQLSRLTQTGCVNLEVEHLEKAICSFTYDEVKN